MVEEMSRAGLTIGSHTKSHVLLPVESGDRQLDELMGSRNILGRVLGASPRHFAYPDGRFDARSAATVSAAGYRFAYTTCNHRLSAYPLLTIPRRMLWEQSCVDSAGHFSPSIMNCQVYGVFDWFTRCPYTHDYAATNVSQALGGRNRATRAQWHGGGDA
jgi:peptidoglycan/xylan/chitin deacetylase (PgdA/CDA1 family)